MVSYGFALSNKPNILFILVDDLGAKDLSNEGSTFYETPNIDQIAIGGMKFTRGYASCQVCSPSRASILTGKYPTNHGITQYIGGPTGADHRKRGRFDSHLPPVYEKNLRASEITSRSDEKNGYKPFSPENGILGAKDHGQQNMDLTLIKVLGCRWPTRRILPPYTNPNLESGPNGESLTPSARAGNR